MKIKLFLFILIFPRLLFSQSDYFRLLNKYDKSDWIRYRFENKVNDKLIEYKSIERLLTNNTNCKIRLNLITKGKVCRKMKETYLYDTSGLINYKIRYGLCSITKRTFWFICELPRNMAYVFTPKDTSGIDKVRKIEKNKKGLITSIISNYWTETYSYDSAYNLIKIEKKFNRLGNDSSGFNLSCANFENKWTFEYDSNNLITKETSFWDDGKERGRSSYSFTNGELTECNSNNEYIKKYHYENGIIHKILIFNHKKKQIGKIKYKWEVVRMHNLIDNQ
jgi:hypothetical protein